jgi:hypothetical protein
VTRGPASGRGAGARARHTALLGAILSSVTVAACGGADGNGAAPSSAPGAGSTSPTASAAGSRSSADVCSFVTSRDVAHALGVPRAPAGHVTGPGARADCQYTVGRRIVTVGPAQTLTPTDAANERKLVLRDHTPGARRLSLAGFVVLAKPLGAQRPGQWSVAVAMVKGASLRTITLGDRSPGPKPRTSALLKAAVRLAKSAATAS